MKKTFTPQTAVGQIVAENYVAASLFDKYGIDFCCHGQATLLDACAGKNISAQEIIRLLENDKESNNFDFLSWPIDLLIDYILKIHHRNIRQKGNKLLELLTKVVGVHGIRHPELKEIQHSFHESLQDLELHLEKEENVLFPYLYHLYSASEQGMLPEKIHCGTVMNPIQVMMAEHDNEGERYRHFSELTNGYTAPKDACASYMFMLSELQNFEKALHEHIHLENNILFPWGIGEEKKQLCTL